MKTKRPTFTKQERIKFTTEYLDFHEENQKHSIDQLNNTRLDNSVKLLELIIGSSIGILGAISIATMFSQELNLLSRLLILAVSIIQIIVTYLGFNTRSRILHILEILHRERANLAMRHIIISGQEFEKAINKPEQEFWDCYEKNKDSVSNKIRTINSAFQKDYSILVNNIKLTKLLFNLSLILLVIFIITEVFTQKEFLDQIPVLWSFLQVVTYFLL